MSTKLSYAVGSRALIHDRECVITAQVDVDHLTVQFKDNGSIESVSASMLKPLLESVTPSTKPIDALPQKALEVARERYDAIEPILNAECGVTGIVREQAEKVGKSVATLYRWLKAYKSYGRLSDLASKRNGKRKPRLSKQVEAIIKDVIETVYLKKQKVTQQRAIDQVMRRCKAARIKPPHDNTIRARIAAISPQERIKRRQGSKAARYEFGEVKGPFPGADYPLAVVQIDHTKVDIELVDDEHRLPIGRPWITLAIDVYSRMIVGMYLSLDAPSAFSVGMCLCHAMLRKDGELKRFNIEGDWPVWGKMRTVHADNGKDFRSETILQSCQEHGINVEWRPVGQPHFGGHIERLMGTLATQTHALPGTTFANIRQKGEYKSEKKAALTLDELHRWLLHFIVGDYHQKMHSKISMSPLNKWRDGILGKGRMKGTGMPDPIADPERLRLDFLPSEKRTVQREGIAWGKVHYFSDSIRHWVKAKKGGRAVKFLVRRDPRDISRLYFLDPELGEYLDVPYRNITNPSLSLWDFRAAEKRLKDEGRANIDEDAIFEAREEMDRIVQDAGKETRKTRRSKQREKKHAEHRKPIDTTNEKTLEVVVDNTVVLEEEPYDFSGEDLENWEEWS